MSEFFGKAGMPWHGCMIIRRATAADGKFEEGEFVVRYFDMMMNDKKEDGLSSLSSVRIAIEKTKEETPGMEGAWVKTDGAGAYSGIEFTVGLAMMNEMTGIRVLGHFIGEAGCNKSQLDAHFAVSGSALRRLIASGAHDVREPDSLARGLAKVAPVGTTVIHFDPTRTAGKITSATQKGLTQMSHRAYTYDAEGSSFLGLLLRRQSFLGDGLFVPRSQLLPKNERPPPAPRVHFSSADGDGAPARAPDHKQPDVRSDGARARLVSSKAQKAAQRRTKRAAAASAAFEKVLQRRRKARVHFCCLDSLGDVRCSRSFVRAAGLRKHIEGGAHVTGSLRPYAVGHAVGRAHHSDRSKLGCAAATATVVVSTSPTSATITLCAADGFRFTLGDGTSVLLPPQSPGWAIATRLPIQRRSAAQLEFVHWAYTIGERFTKQKFLAAEAVREMKVIGTADSAKMWPNDPYAHDRGGAIFSRLDILDEQVIRGYFSKTADYLKRLATKALSSGGFVEEEDGDDVDDGGRTARRARKRKDVAATAEKQRAFGTAKQPLLKSTPLSELPKLSQGTGVGPATAAHLATQWPTCGDLARATSAQISSGLGVIRAGAGKVRLPAAANVEALAHGLAAHFSPGSATEVTEAAAAGAAAASDAGSAGGAASAASSASADGSASNVATMSERELAAAMGHDEDGRASSSHSPPAPSTCQSRPWGAA